MEDTYKNIFHTASVSAVELYTKVPINTPSVKGLVRKFIKSLYKAEIESYNTSEEETPFEKSYVYYYFVNPQENNSSFENFLAHTQLALLSYSGDDYRYHLELLAQILYTKLLINCKDIVLDDILTEIQKSLTKIQKKS